MAMAKWYERARWSIPDDFMQFSHFQRAVARLDWTSSPGYPYMLRHVNNGQFFSCKDGVPSQERLDAVWSMVQQRLLKGDADPIRLFVKPEAHSEKKLKSEKYRLISSVSVVDQIIDHMLFGDLNDVMIENWIHIPNKPGWAPFGGGWRFIPKETWVATDASSWDWTVQPWLLELALEFRKRQCVNLTRRWEELANWRYACLFRDPLFVTTAGHMFRQKQPGVMKSGCVNTIADNSVMQVLLHLRVCAELGQKMTYLFTMGDDRLQEPVEDPKSYYEMTSQFCILKSVAHVNEFAGFRFRGKWVEPVHKAKHAYNILHMEDSVVVPLAHSYMLNYHRSQFKQFMEDLFRKMDVEPVPEEIRDLVYDGM
uniref:RNA-directed RNA polymerase n=1 Tax=Scaphoideus titanus sobemo-like virus 1 TaxID=2716557 RepID=A0A6G7NRT4_9VIRU|nr:RNA-directed RNA polymerase [Scaphoideus titanus sobemo-like virus 1]